MLMFRVLGPVGAVSGARVEEINGRLQRTLLLLLLVNRNNLVQTESLIGELWGEQHPGHVVNALHAHVSRLRRRLAELERPKQGRGPGTAGLPEAGPDGSPPRLHTDTIGYQLSVADHEFDAVLFERGVEQMRAYEGDPARACLELRRLLRMWHGPVFGGGDFDSPTLQAAATRYAELRISALELLFDHELALGRYGAVIPELSELITEHRFKERFHGQLMVALYRSGRQNDALEVYRRLRIQLDECLGLEPSPEMRAFERALIEHDRILWDARVREPDAFRRLVAV